MAQMAQNDIIGLILKCFDDGTQSVPAQDDEKIEHQTSKHCLVDGSKRIRLGF